MNILVDDDRVSLHIQIRITITDLLLIVKSLLISPFTLLKGYDIFSNIVYLELASIGPG